MLGRKQIRLNHRFFSLYCKKKKYINPDQLLNVFIVFNNNNKIYNNNAKDIEEQRNNVAEITFKKKFFPAVE